MRSKYQEKKCVICEAPITLDPQKTKELSELARKNECVLMEGIKTAFSTAYIRLILLAKSGKIGKIVSVDATCTSLTDLSAVKEHSGKYIWNSICAWGSTAMLPVFQLLGTNYTSKHIITSFVDETGTFDRFTKIDFVYSDSTASIKVGKGSDILPPPTLTLRGGGFSLKCSSLYSINELTPCVPRFLF